MTRPIITATADTARAMHAAEMRGQDMQEAPERIFALHHGWEVTPNGNVQIGQWAETHGLHGGIGYTGTNLCITEAECQRRIDAAVAAERDVLRWAHDTLLEINPSNYSHDDVCLLNDASVEVILGIAPLIGETHGKSAEWWADRAAAIRARGQK